MENSTLENYTGCLLGGAVDDALGAPVEFLSLRQILNRYGEEGILGYVEFTDGVGRITDDTQMTLFTAEALLHTMNRATQRGIWGAYLQIAHDSYLRWLFTQNEPMPRLDENRPPMTGWMIEQREFYHRRAPGNTCLSALRSGICGTMEFPINNSKGCGGIMRVAPVGLIKSFKPANAFQYGAELAAITHGHPSGYLSAGAFAAIIAYIRDGFLLKNAVMGALNLLKKYPSHKETSRALLNAVGLSETTEPTFENIKKWAKAGLVKRRWPSRFFVPSITQTILKKR